MTTKEDGRLFDGIIAESETTAASIIAEAQATAEKKLADAQAKADHDREVERHACALRLEQVRLRGESTKRNAARKAMLHRMDSCYDVVMDAVHRKLAAVSQTPAFSSVLVDWIVEAAIGLDLTQAKVSSSLQAPVTQQMLEEAARKIKKVTGATIVLTLDPRPIQETGVIVSSLDGNVSYNNQTDVRLRRFDRDIKQLVEEGTCKAE